MQQVKAVCSELQLSPDVLKVLIENCKEPLVIKGQLQPWRTAKSWKAEHICQTLLSKPTIFKVFPRRGTEVYRDFSMSRNKTPDETDCVFVEGKFGDFWSWWKANANKSEEPQQPVETKSKKSTSTSPMSSSDSGVSVAKDCASTSDNASRTMTSNSSDFLTLSFSTPQQPCSCSLLEFPASDFWVYSDYNYLSKLCAEAPELVDNVDWSILGFGDQSSQDSALWMGSVGAFTPCHQDTYGFNIVAMLSGEKTWTLFSPEDSKYMYPSRIPFEESSVFCEVDVADPDHHKHPLYKQARPYQVVLEEGDVLVVPRHWWHYVECTGTHPSVSINTWVNLPSDSLDRLKEAVVRSLVSSFSDLEETGSRQLVNPNEELFSNEVNIGLVDMALNDYKKSIKSKRSSKDKGKVSREEDKCNEFLKAVTSAPVVDAIVKALGVEDI